MRHWAALLWAKDKLEAANDAPKPEQKRVKEYVSKMLLTVRFEFRKIDDPQNMRWVAIQGREDIAEDFHVMGRTGYQRVMEVA